ncbi:hypothetical protein T4D_4809 [Trichinella pseudospiralis]|uniref:Uncharacterized protein n=1 Tax=Trichinella pseudospiralis TaxID=6337 RepID=A0A0V1FCA5_TRIPS|nr:hypothetical protein T4D_4809 [Trichinella pseudospiralis]
MPSSQLFIEYPNENLSSDKLPISNRLNIDTLNLVSVTDIDFHLKFRFLIFFYCSRVTDKRYFIIISNFSLLNLTYGFKLNFYNCFYIFVLCCEMIDDHISINNIQFYYSFVFSKKMLERDKQMHIECDGNKKLMDDEKAAGILLSSASRIIRRTRE